MSRARWPRKDFLLLHMMPIEKMEIIPDIRRRKIIVELVFTINSLYPHENG
jgi:hypothetical protein